jgi:hypothetical protein
MVASASSSRRLFDCIPIEVDIVSFPGLDFNVPLLHS